MDLCTKAKIKDITVYCNCSEPTTANLEEDDYNFLNYKELYFEPSSDQKIVSFWKYLDYQNVPLPRVGRPKSPKHRKQQKYAKFTEKHAKIDEKRVKLDEKLKQDAEFKSIKWADKLAYFQHKGYDKILTQKKSCKICNNDDFGPMFADMNCGTIVSGLPCYRQSPVHKKVGIQTRKNEYISATNISSETSLPSNKLAPMSDKAQDGSKSTVQSQSSEKSLNTLNNSHSLIDLTQATVYEKITKSHYAYTNFLQASDLSAYSETSQPNTETSIVQLFDTPAFLINAVSNTETRLGPHLRRPKKIMFHSRQENRRSATIIGSLPDSEAQSACDASILNS